ncbi:hypothetical protein, partial [Pseudomonas sp. SDO5222_S391]
ISDTRPMLSQASQLPHLIFTPFNTALALRLRHFNSLFPTGTSCYCTDHKAQAAWIGSLT